MLTATLYCGNLNASHFGQYGIIPSFSSSLISSFVPHIRQKVPFVSIDYLSFLHLRHITRTSLISARISLLTIYTAPEIYSAPGLDSRFFS